MKKIIALILALVMTLSLLPMNVWATDGDENLDPASEQQENVVNEPEPQATEPAQLYWMRENWTNSEYVIDRGRNDWLRVSIDGTNYLAYDAATQSISATSGLGDITLGSMNENGTPVTAIVWDATNVGEASGTITLTVGGVDYVLNARTVVEQMGLGSNGGDYSTAIKLDKTSYEWVLYARQWDDSLTTEDKTVYTRVTSDNFTIPAGSRLSWNTDGDKLVFDATGLTADSFPVDVYVTSSDRYKKNYYFTVDYDDGSFMYNGVKIYTKVDTENNILTYETPATHDGLFVDNGNWAVTVPYEKTKATTIYLRPQGDVTSMEVRNGKLWDYEKWVTLEYLANLECFALTLKAGYTDPGDAFIVKKVGNEDRGDIRIAFEAKADDPSEVQLWNYDGGWTNDRIILDVGMVRQFQLAIGPQANKTVLTPDNIQEFGVSGNIGALVWENGRFRIDTSTATDSHGLIKVKYNGAYYYLAVQVMFKDMYVEDDFGSYESFVICDPQKTLSFDAYVYEFDGRNKINKDRFVIHTDKGTVSWVDADTVQFDPTGLTAADFPVTMAATDWQNNNINYKLEITTEAIIGSMRYYQTDYSTIAVRISPTQAKVLTLPEKLNDNGELVITIKNKNMTAEEEAAWRQLINDENGLSVGYQFIAKNAISGTPSDIFQFWSFDSDAQMQVSDLHETMWNIVDLEGEENCFHAYNETWRGNGDSFAWATANEDDIAILPSDSRDIFAWIFRYNDGSDPVEDGFAMKFVPEQEALTYIDATQYAPVDEERFTYIPHENLDVVLSIDEYDAEATGCKFKYDEEGVLTYSYQGTETVYENIIQDMMDESAADGIVPDQWGVLYYNLLEVAAPTGYMAKLLECSYYTEDTCYGAKKLALRYHWRGSPADLTFTLTWFDPTGVGPEIVEQVTIRMPKFPDAPTWMDYTAAPMDDGRIKFDQPENSGAVNSASDGLMWTQYADNELVDVNEVLATEVYFEAPSGATKYLAMYFGDGRDDATINLNSEEMVESYVDALNRMDAQNAFDVINWGTETNPIWGTDKAPLEGLLKQTYGVNDEIEYYYSANRGTRGYFIKWFFEDGSAPVCEYVRLNTSPYVCLWESIAVDDIEDVADNVEKPEIVFDENIKLTSRIHPQNKSGHFFFELEVVGLDDEANARLEQQGNKFIIILPYEFMGVDENGDPWTYETASKMKSAKIQHFDEDFTLKDNQGVLDGKFTKRGIEFEVDSFSPFMLVYEDATPTAPSYGGYYPIVTPDKDAEETPTDTKPVVTPATPVEDDVTPTPEDTTPVVPDEPVVDDPVVDEPPVDDATQSSGGNAGLWIGIGIVALAAIVVVLAIMAVRKKRK